MRGCWQRHRRPARQKRCLWCVPQCSKHKRGASKCFARKCRKLARGLVRLPRRRSRSIAHAGSKQHGWCVFSLPEPYRPFAALVAASRRAVRFLDRHQSTNCLGKSVHLAWTPATLLALSTPTQVSQWLLPCTALDRSAAIPQRI